MHIGLLLTIENPMGCLLVMEFFLIMRDPGEDRRLSQGKSQWVYQPLIMA